MKEKPVITKYSDPVSFVRDAIKFRKENERSFSVLQACKKLRRCSPALITLILKQERTITVDRASDLCKIMGLSHQEKTYFVDWIDRLSGGETSLPTEPTSPPRRKAAPISLLQDWLNVYVKDAFQIPSIQKDMQRVFTLLGGIASKSRIEKSIRFLISNGYLRNTLDGKTVIDTPLNVSDEGTPSTKIRQFHRASLKIARDAVEQYPMTERTANALVIPIDEDELVKLNELVAEFSEKLKVFSEKKQTSSGKRLYQVLINISPTGGKS